MGPHGRGVFAGAGAAADIYQNPDREKFPRVGITKWTVPLDDRSCRIVAWRHFNDTV